MSDRLVLAALLLFAAPLWALSPFLYLPVAGLACLLVAVLTAGGDDK